MAPATLCAAIPIALAIFAQQSTSATRSEGLPSVLLEIAVWGVAFALFASRPGKTQLRISDPGVVLLGWCLYFFILPSFAWLEGRPIWQAGSPLAYMSSALFITVQHLHAAFIIVFAGIYRATTPALSFEPLKGADTRRLLPTAHRLIAVGLVPVAIELVNRIMTTGSLRPVATYGDFTFNQHDDVAAAAASGGFQYILVQLSFKVEIVAFIALGIGFGLLFADCFVNKKWARLGWLHLAFPLIMYFGPGARSYVAMVLIMAIILADFFAGRIPWRYLGAVTLVGIAFFNFYGSFRRYQSEGLRDAIIAAQQEDDEDADVATGEGPAMLMKEAFMVSWVDQTHTEQGLDYFVESALWLVPSQFIPEKVHWTATADFLSRELLGGDAERGGGVAGAMVATGYSVGGIAGALILAAVLALIAGGLVRAVVGSPKTAIGPPILSFGLLASFGSQMFWFIRGDLPGVFAMILYRVAVPALIFAAWRNLSRVDSPIRLRLQRPR